MTKQELFVLADQSLNKVVDQIKDEQWEMEIPEEFSIRTDKPMTLRDVINYHAYDDAWIPDMFAGKTMEEAGKGKFEGDLLGDSPRSNFQAIVEKACDAISDLDNLDFTVHYTYGDYPAGEALEHAIIFRGLRVYALSKLIGIDTKMPDKLVQGLWDVIEPQAEELRSYGVLTPPRKVPEDASLQEKLIGLTGMK